MDSASATSVQLTACIDPEVFFNNFLAIDPKYGAIGPVLDRLRREMQALLGIRTLSFSDFVDMTSIEYDENGEIIPKEEETLKALAKSMKNIDVTREALRSAATSGLTSQQIAEGPTCIKIPIALLSSHTGFPRLVDSLSEEYRQCPDYPTLIRMVCELRVYQKPFFLLFDGADRITAYYSPSWSMQEMRDRILMTDVTVAVEIYNAKTPINTLCSQVRETPGGHIKILYLGRRQGRSSIGAG